MLLDDPAALLAAIPGLHDVTLADCETYIAARDLTDDQPRERKGLLLAEAEAPIAAAPWEPGTYAKDEIVSHNGAAWRSLIPSNVWEPGVAGWRECWAEKTDTPPDWLQPTGSADYYTLGELVAHNGQTWRSDYAVNVWEPGVFGWTLVEEQGGGTPEWQAGVAYAIGDEVTYQGITYSCRQAHTAQLGWEPPNVPALWEVV
jgi:Carbohydrate binding domain.